MGRPKGLRLNRDAFDHLIAGLGQTMSSISADADIPLSTLSGLRHGEHCASAAVATRLADALGCRVGAIFPEATHRFVQADTDQKDAA
jgi:hypothetical protein